MLPSVVLRMLKFCSISCKEYTRVTEGQAKSWTNSLHRIRQPEGFLRRLAFAVVCRGPDILLWKEDMIGCLRKSFFW